MKITAVETTPISVPRKRAYGAVPRTALGPADLSEYGLVQHRNGHYRPGGTGQCVRSPGATAVW